MQVRSTIWIALTVFLLGSCIEEIQVDLPDSEGLNQLVVDGQIHTGPGPYIIRLQRVVGRGLRSFSPILGASGKVFTLSGKEEAIQELGEGQYILPGEVVWGEVNETYILELNVDGETYRSAEEQLPVPVRAEAIRWQQIDKEFLSEENVVSTLPYVEIRVDTPIPNREKGPFLRWRTLETYSLVENPPPPPGSFSRTCYFTFPTNLQEILLFNGEGFSGTRWENQWVGDREIDWTFAGKHVFSVIQYSTTDASFSYWSRVQQVSNQVGSIFDVPPAAIGGNIQNVNNPQEQVLGLFEVVSTDTIRTITFKPDFDPRLARPFCVNLGVFDRRQPRECNNCLLLEGASEVRPSFF